MASLFGTVQKTPAALAENALASFQKAQDDLAVAQAAIDAQRDEHLATIVEAQAKADDAEAHSARLTRVRGKLADLLA